MMENRGETLMLIHLSGERAKTPEVLEIQIVMLSSTSLHRTCIT